MKLKNLIACFFLGFIMVPYIQNETPNAGAGIIICTVSGDVLSRNPIIEDKRVTLIVEAGTDITVLAPKFTLTPGASIVPISGTMLNLTTPQYCEVTSEDREWRKKYEAGVTFSGTTDTMYHFENIRFDSEGKYHISYGTGAQGKEIAIWTSGNVGFAFTDVKTKAEEYPTSQASNGIEGKCLKLVTCEAGYRGSLLGMPTAAGNLFSGSFEVRPTDILRSAKFGIPLSNIPIPTTGYHKYKIGKSLRIDDRPVDNKKDICDIYAVFYETDEKLPILDGINVSAEDSTYIVSVARVKDARETGEWIKSDLPFEYRTGKSVDTEKLKAGKYNLAIVFSSDMCRDHSEGTPGSTFYIDEVLLNFTNK